MEAGECGRTRGTCFIACRLEVVAVAGLLWLSWCVFGGADFFVCLSFFRFFFLRTYTAYCKTLPHYLSTSAVCCIYRYIPVFYDLHDVNSA